MPGLTAFRLMRNAHAAFPLVFCPLARACSLRHRHGYAFRRPVALDHYWQADWPRGADPKFRRRPRGGGGGY